MIIYCIACICSLFLLIFTKSLKRVEDLSIHLPISLVSETGIQRKVFGCVHHSAAAAAKSRQSCPTLCDPTDGGPPGSHPWDSPGKYTGVGCHFLLQCMKVKSESEVAQSCPTLCNPMDCSLPGASVHGIFQARVLESAAIAFFDQLGSLLQMSIMSGETLGRKCITKLCTRQIIHEHRKWP